MAEGNTLLIISNPLLYPWFVSEGCSVFGLYHTCV